MSFIRKNLLKKLKKNEDLEEVKKDIQDITEEKELKKLINHKQEEIDRLQRGFQVLIQESSDVFEIIKPDGTIKYISDSVERITGHKPEERIGKKAYEFYEGKELQKLNKMIKFVLDNPEKKVTGDIVFKMKTGKEMFLEVNMRNLLHDSVIEGIVVNFRDITRRKETEKRMARIATHDGLTGLPNNIHFKKKLRIQCQYAKEKQVSFAVMMLDISGFKYIIDALGYELGDELIVKISERLKTFLGDKKFICRYFGVQFAIIISGLSSIEEYESITKDIINLFNSPFKVDKYELSVAVNIGVSIYPEDELDGNSLVKYANIALTRAKQEGKNIYEFYSSKMDIQSYKQFILKNDLRKAIEKDQLRVYYQPMINLKTNKILAAEALIRWEHPDWGIILPDEFISLAEETGLIIKIGKWILREVCHNYKQWLDDGLLDIKVSVNFSSIQFLENNFVDNIKSIIDEYKLDPHFLIMEITESIFMGKAEKVASDIQKLQSFGIQVALDDFGTGFSSLAYLNFLNIDILKIDGYFIKDITLNKTSTVITKSIINMAHELDIKLVAEGIENQEQLFYLQKLNCHIGQGYIFGKPVGLKEFEQILDKRKSEAIVVDEVREKPNENRRKFFRIEFDQLLEANLTIKKFKGKKMGLGNTKVLVKDIGPGGICILSNLNLPVKKDIILQFTAKLVESEIDISGHPVRKVEVDDKLYEYGIEFIVDENERMELIKILNKVQIKVRKKTLFAEEGFISTSAKRYFNL